MRHRRPPKAQAGQRWPKIGLERHRRRQDRTKQAPKLPKMGPREAQESPKGSPRSPREAKRELKRGQKAAQERTKTPTAARVTRFQKRCKKLTKIMYFSMFWGYRHAKSSPRRQHKS